MVRLVIVREVGLDVVAPSDNHALGSLLHRSDELVLLHARPIAAHHVHGFIHCEERIVKVKVCNSKALYRNVGVSLGTYTGLKV